MKKLITTILTTLLITGCAITNQGGNYTSMTEDLQESLAKDAALIIDKEYPPATTSLQINQNVNDVFGTKLINYLRQAGFAISDITNMSTNALQLQYYLTNLAEDYYRLTLKVDDKTYNRAYYGGVGVSAWTKGD